MYERSFREQCLMAINRTLKHDVDNNGEVYDEMGLLLI